MTKTDARKMYTDLSSLDCFLNRNDGTEKIKNLFSQVKQGMEDAETPEIKFVWMEMLAGLTSLMQKITDGLEVANKQALKLGYKIIK